MRSNIVPGEHSKYTKLNGGNRTGYSRLKSMLHIAHNGMPLES